MIAPRPGGRGRVRGPVAGLPERLRSPLHGRSARVLGLAAAVGVAAGAAVALFDLLAAGMLDAVLGWPLGLRAVAPGVGLLLTAAALHLLAGGATPASADEYIRNYHQPTTPLPLRPVLGRLVASLATLGFGGSMGYEGPAMYSGAAIGSATQRRLSRWFTPDDAKVLMVAGAAAGVAAVFKAPATGLVFALEVPYREDLARRMLLPAGIAAASGYLVFATLAGTEPLLPVSGSAPFDLRDLGGAVAIGLVAGITARFAVRFLTVAKAMTRRGRPMTRAAVAGAVLAGLLLAGTALGVPNPTLGPGYDTIEWALDPGRGVLLLVVLAALRLVATGATLGGGGGVAGLFIPLVVQGALLGRIAGALVEPANPSLFPVLGIAAFLGAGYRVPLASVVFVAEITGRPGFVVPGLIAAIVAQLPMGDESVSSYQLGGRRGHLERRLALPVAQVVDTEAPTVPPDATVNELFWQHLVGRRRRSVAVVDGGDYLGLVRAEDLAALDRATWSALPVSAIARPDLPVVELGARVDEALAAMDGAGVDLVAVLSDGRYVGTVSVDDVVRLDDVIDRARFGAATAG